MQLVAPLPFEEAVSKFGERSPVTSVLKSADWRHVPIALRERAFFSATVENARFLKNAQSEIADFLTNARATNERGQSYLKSGGRAAFIERMQQFAIRSGMGPLDPEDKGTLKDIRSEGRLALVFDTNVKAAQDYGYYQQGQDPEVLDAFPAQRFIRVRLVKKPRAWHRAHEGEVHRKDDLAFWLDMNRDFHVPWGPWGFNSGMDVEDVGRREAEALGLVKSTEDFTKTSGNGTTKTQTDFNAHLQASTQGLGDRLVHFLKLAFNDKCPQVRFDGDTVQWAISDIQSHPLPFAPKVPTPAAGKGITKEPEKATKEETRIVNKRQENAYIYGSDGDVLFFVRGERDASRIRFTLEQLVQMKDATLTHNHPSGSAFSFKDIQFAINNDLAEMRIIAPGYAGQAHLYRLIRPAGGWQLSENQIRNAVEQRTAEMIAWRKSQVKEGHMSRAAARAAEPGELYKRLQKAFPGVFMYQEVAL